MTWWRGVRTEGYLPCPQVRVAQEVVHKRPGPPIQVQSSSHSVGTSQERPAGNIKLGRTPFRPRTQAPGPGPVGWLGPGAVHAASHSQVAVFEKPP